MSNKTDVLSFDSVFKQTKDDAKPMLDLMGCPELLGDILNDIETNRRRFKIFYDAGKQSKQDEIDRIVGIITEAYKSGGNSSVETVYDKIQELLK